MNPKALIGGMFYGLAKHLYYCLVSKNYRTLSLYQSRYGRRGRYKETLIALGKRQLIIPDVASFLSMYEEIYLHRIYEIEMKKPRILDLGANVGISVLWFKENYPQSDVVAVEADPGIFRCLQHNTSGLSGVDLLNVAVWDEDGELAFHSEGADGGHLKASCDAASESKSVSVIARDIRTILKEHGPFDFIKMDIEGAEATVLPACGGLLQKTRYLFCEYHSSPGEQQYLSELLTFLKAEGFRIHIQPVNVRRQPLMKHSIDNFFDMQANVFAWKE